MSSRLSYGAMSKRPTIVTEVQKPSQRPCMIRFLREVCSQLIERKALSWGIVRKSACILAEITIRKSQLQTLCGEPHQLAQILREGQPSHEVQITGTKNALWEEWRCLKAEALITF